MGFEFCEKQEDAYMFLQPFHICKTKCELKKALKSPLVNCRAFELRQLLRRADLRSKGNKLMLFVKK